MSREAQKRQTRRRILAAASESFEQRGFEATTMRSVAESAGVAVGTVFVHFEDKRDLLHSALFHQLDRVLQEAIEHAPAEGVRARLHHLTVALFDYYTARPELSRTLLRESLLATGAWQERFTAQVTRVHGVVAQWLTEARERGEVAPSLDPALGAVAYFSFYYFALISWVQGQPLEPIGLVDRLLIQHLEPSGGPPS